MLVPDIHQLGWSWEYQMVDDALMSYMHAYMSQRCGGANQGSSSWAAKAKPSSSADDDGADYGVFYQRLGMQ
jgi:hypothetical protein